MSADRSPASVRAGALVTVRPGPVLHVWDDGREVARVVLGLGGALALIRALAGSMEARDA